LLPGGGFHVAWIAAVVCLALLGFGSPEVRAHAGLHDDIERATRALEQSPDNGDLYARRAHYYRLGGHYEEALADLVRARELEPGNMAVALGLGMTYSALERDGEAEAELDRVISAGQESVRAFSERAAVRARGGRLQEAIDDYSRAIEIQRDIELYLRRGELQEATGDLRAAVVAYFDGFEHLGGAVTLRLALIRVETQRGEYESALAYIDQELQRAPVKTSWCLRKAEVLRAAGRAEEAGLALDMALTEANEVIEKRATGIHLYSRAKVYAALGRTDEAKQDLENVLVKSPRFSEARKLMEQLETQETTQED